MPATPSPIDGPMGPMWTAIMQASAATKAKTAGLSSQAQQGGSYDGKLNTTSLSGSNLNQVVEIGGSWLQTAASKSVPAGQAPGVFVATGLSGSGICTPTGIATGTITLTKGSFDATIDSTLKGAFTAGQQIGAYILNTTNGTTTEAITPGTTISSISSGAVVLSAPAIESGSGLYCAACTFQLV